MQFQQMKESVTRSANSEITSFSCTTWLTSDYQSLMSLLGSISDPPVDDSWSFHDTGCKCTVDGWAFSVTGPQAWNLLPDNLNIRVLAETAFANF